MKVNLETVGKVLEVVCVVGGVAVALFSRKQVKETAELIDCSVKELSDMDTIEVKEEIVNQAIEKSVDKQVEKITSKVYQRVYNETLRRATEWVDSTIKGLYSSISEKVTKQVATEVAKIDQEKLKKDVTVQAKQIIVEKFDGQLDDQLVEFNKNLENVGKIYQSIAQRMDPGTGNAGKSVNLTLS